MRGGLSEDLLSSLMSNLVDFYDVRISNITSQAVNNNLHFFDVFI